MGETESKGKGLGKAVVFLGGIALGYLANSIFAGPQNLQKRLEARITENPIRYEAILQREFETGYKGWIEAQKAKGVNVDFMQTIQPVLYTDPNTGAGMDISDLARNTKNPVRRLQSGGIVAGDYKNAAIEAAKQEASDTIDSIGNKIRGIGDYFR